MKSVCIIVPYFGQWPEWFGLYLHSCRMNPSINWIFFTDCQARCDAPVNVRFVSMEWDECVALVCERCGLQYGPSSPYKMCDFRFAFGEIFKEYLTEYVYWGFGDVDVIYGDLDSFITDDVLSHNLITFNKTHVSGHFTLLRNCDEINERFRAYLPWKRDVETPRYMGLDERIGFYGITDVYAVESYNTPLSYYTPWVNGDFIFPAYWYYRKGQLYNNIDGGRKFMYLHFMRYKYIWRSLRLSSVVHFEKNQSELEWKLCLDGFRLCSCFDESSERDKAVRIYQRFTATGTSVRFAAVIPHVCKPPETNDA